MEAGIASDRERVCFSEPGRARQAHVNGKNRLESHAQESWRDKISDLQLASRLLHSVERSATDAVVERARRHTSPETQASLPVGNGRSGTKGRRENEQTAVRKTRAVT